MRHCLLILCVLSVSHSAAAQQYELLLKGGTVIDPRNNRNGVADVAIASGKIAQVAANIPAASAKRVVDVTGLYVVPGLIDVHSHIYAGNLRGAHAAGQYSIYPDGHTFRACATTIGDGGSSGWRNFRDFKDGVIALSKTRVLVWLNIVGLGLSGIAHSQNVADMDPELAAKTAKEFPDIIVGFKTVQWQGKEWINVDRALEAGRLANLPVLFDFGRFWPQDRPYQELVGKKMRPGDVSTHMYKRDVPLFDESGKLLPYLAEARQRGVKFDLGHGLGDFDFRSSFRPSGKGGSGRDFHRSSRRQHEPRGEEPHQSDVEDDGRRDAIRESHRVNDLESRAAGETSRAGASHSGCRCGRGGPAAGERRLRVHRYPGSPHEGERKAGMRTYNS